MPSGDARAPLRKIPRLFVAAALLATPESGEG